MHKTFLCTVSAFFLLAFSGCSPDSNDNAALCNNGIRDGRETEIDCNGDCAPCPEAPALSCTLGGTEYISTNVAGQTLHPSIRIYGNDENGRPMNFMFIPNALNQAVPIVSVSLSYQGEPYTYGENDTGSVVITAMDTLRKIVSGTFSFSARRVTKNTSVTVENGSFTNVRYNH